MNGLRKGNSLVVDRISVYGNHGNRYGVMRNLDVHMVRGGKMREAIIISVILIVAVIIWMPRKGGKQ